MTDSAAGSGTERRYGQYGLILSDIEGPHYGTVSHQTMRDLCAHIRELTEENARLGEACTAYHDVAKVHLLAERRLLAEVDRLNTQLADAKRTADELQEMIG